MRVSIAIEIADGNSAPDLALPDQRCRDHHIGPLAPFLTHVVAAEYLPAPAAWAQERRIRDKAIKDYRRSSPRRPAKFDRSV